MKIALVTSSFLPELAGAELVVHHLANEWSKQGHVVRVLNTVTNDVCHPEALYSVRRYSIARGATRYGYHSFPWLQYSVYSLARQIKKFEPDVISGHFALPVAFYLANLRPRRRWIITSHGSDITGSGPGSMRRQYNVDAYLGSCINEAFRAIAISSAAARDLQSLGVDPAKIVSIPNGVDTERFRRRSATDIRARFGLPPGSSYILTVARNNPVKNLEMGIRVFSRIAATYQYVYYLVIGKDVTRLKDKARDSGVEGRVVLQEELLGDDLVAAYQQATLYLSTSVREGCPLTILEAMASGLGQVATDVPGNEDLVDNEKTGFLVAKDDENRMAEAIRLLLDNGDMREAMRQANVEKSESYTWGEIGRRYLEVMEPSGVPRMRLPGKTSAAYLLRFDDICPAMNWKIWRQIEALLVVAKIKPLLAVVPNNLDPTLNVSDANPDFWDEVRRWQSMGWGIAMHGYQHVYTTRKAGIVGINRYSEFAGLPEHEQEQKIKAGLDIFNHNGISTNMWIAPAHSFDKTTISVLKKNNISIVNDGWFGVPGLDGNDMFWIPQQLWDFRKQRRGVWTVCYHFNAWDASDVEKLRRYIHSYRFSVTDVESVIHAYGDRRIDPVDSLYFKMRKLKYQTLKLAAQKASTD